MGRPASDAINVRWWLDLGRQTGTLVARLLESNNLDRGPRTETEVREVVVTLNSRIARLLGLEPARREGVQVLK